jgi:hypothetical protein
LDQCFARQSLRICRVQQVPIHGGSLRLFAGRDGRQPDPSVAALLKEESDWGVASPQPYLGFRDKVARLRGQLTELLSDLKRKGKRIAAYGASAKGSTLLNHFGIGRETLDFVADRSTVKQGLFTPGTHLPICAPSRLLDDMPDYTLLLTWNFADEILEQQQEYRNRGGRFVIPLPQPRVV